MAKGPATRHPGWIRIGEILLVGEAGVVSFKVDSLMLGEEAAVGTAVEGVSDLVLGLGSGLDSGLDSDSGEALAVAGRRWGDEEWVAMRGSQSKVLRDKDKDRDRDKVCHRFPGLDHGVEAVLPLGAGAV
jgi:hypothetical protein